MIVIQCYVLLHLDLLYHCEEGQMTTAVHVCSSALRRVPVTSAHHAGSCRRTYAAAKIHVQKSLTIGERERERESGGTVRVREGNRQLEGETQEVVEDSRPESAYKERNCAEHRIAALKLRTEGKKEKR